MKILRINIDGTMNDITIKTMTMKNLDAKSIRKGNTDLKQLYKWKYSDKEIRCFGWYDGDQGFENKHDLIPGGNSDFLCDEDSSEKLLFGDIFLTSFDINKKKYVDFCASDYGNIYEHFFDGFDDCETSDEYSDDEEKATEEDKVFINDESDDSDSENEYSSSDDKELDEDIEEYTTEEEDLEEYGSD